MTLMSPGPSRSASVATPASAPDAVDSSASKDMEVVDPELDTEILSLLGDAPKPDTKFGKGVHKDLAMRWQEILDKGLLKETKDKLLLEYLIPENCSLLVAPSLNPEVKAALAESMVKRDSAIMAKQKQLGIAVAALTQAVELIIAKENHTKILKPVSDACRLICDSHHAETNTRRGFVVTSINADLRDALKESKRDTLLFGDNISDKLKTAKSVKKSGTDLKPVPNEKSPFNKNNFIKNKKNDKRLNWRPLPWKTTTKTDAGKPRPQQRPFRKSSFQQRETAERTPVTRSHSRRY